MEFIAEPWTIIVVIAGFVAAFTKFGVELLKFVKGVREVTTTSDKESIIYKPTIDEIQKYGKKLERTTLWTYPLVLVSLIGFAILSYKNTIDSHREKIAHR